MKVNKTAVSMVIAFVFFFILGASGTARKIQASFTFQTQNPSNGDVDQAIQNAFQKNVQQNRNQILGLSVFEVVVDRIQYSADRSTALLWLALKDPQTGEIVASEPGLSIAHSANPSALANPDNWSFTMQQESTFTSQLGALPPELLTDDLRNRFLSTPQSPSLVSAAPLRGYKLPWTAGLAKKVTNTIGHVFSVSGGLTSCPSSCRYAYDFADGTMFPLLAAKGGTVRAYKTSCSNGDSNCTNYLILEDQSTVPTSYQLYYHMANNSVPDRLRTIGTRVNQGEYIGDADDTGFSTGNHLHFHVYTTPTGTNWSWGNSVDFTFDDVSTNGGYPRTCSEAAEYPNLGSQCNPGNLYVSGNTPANPPSAQLSSPANRSVITTRTLQVSGSAKDDIQVTRIQVMANYDGTWNSIAEVPAGSGNFTQNIDLCSAGIPDGPFGLTLRVYDREGSLAPNVPIRQLIKNVSCSSANQPPVTPACQPSANQVALYSDADYRGNCTRFDVNNSAGYTSSQLGAVGDNMTTSIQVGSNVRAVLYDHSTDVTAAHVTGRLETLTTNDANLSDNQIGAGTVSGLWVISRTDMLDKPYVNSFGNQVDANANPTSLDSLVLAWEGGSGASSYDITLTGPGAGWTKNVAGRMSLSIGNLAAGDYSLTVVGKTSTNTNSGAVKTFTVTSASFPAATTQATPYSEDFEASTGEWTASGLWRYASIDVGGRGATKAWIFNNGSNYADATYRAGDLTSPSITIPAGETDYLRFNYYADVEDGNPYWDQRRVQISDGGPFQDLYQLSDDRQVGQIWLNSGPINLSAYAGKTIRLRFHFDSVDEDYNGGLGWMVDDINISTNAPNTSCASNHNTLASAQAVSVGSTVSGVVCPEGDIDYFKFTGKAGQPLLIDVNAQSLNPASLLDSTLTLLDGDGRSLLAFNDDEQYGVLRDSLITYTLSRDGTYYVKLKPWDYPQAGGPDYFYQLSFSQSSGQSPQSVQILYPFSNGMAPVGAFNITASATDFDGGQVAQVEFYWHGPDWSIPQWTKLGTDTDGSNGWSYNVNPAQYGGTKGSAVYVQATSKAGGVLGAVVWDLVPDLTTPVSQMSPLAATINSTVVQLKWTASDPQGDIDHFDIQYQSNSGSGWSAWQNWTARSLPGYLTSTWFSGTPGVSYRFRMRAVDHAGNTEPYPDTAEASTQLASTCIADPAETNGQTLETSITLDRSSTSAVYNFCKAGQPTAQDSDWFTVNSQQAGEQILIMLISKGGGAAFSATLYDASHQPLATFQSLDYGLGRSIRWISPGAGTYYLEVKPLQPTLFGTDVLYQVYYGSGNWIFLPLISH